MRERMLITNDADFGGLVFRRGLTACGIALLRLSTNDSRKKARRLMDVLPTVEDRIEGHFIVVEGCSNQDTPTSDTGELSRAE